MDNQEQENILKAIRKGQKIKAIKLLREVENLSLKDAKDKVDALQKVMNSRDQTQQQRKTLVHTHPAARNDRYNIEKDLPTEAFLFLQKGEVANAIKIIKANRGENKSAATHLVKTFYQQHPEYQSAEIDKFMRTNSRSKSAIEYGKNHGKQKSPNFIEIIIVGIVIFFILVNVLK